MSSNTNVLAGLAMLVVASTVQAAAVDVSYTVSGSPGTWALEFSVTNNLVGSDRNDLYLFGVRLPTSPAILGSPTGWTLPASQSANWFGSGGSATDYNNIWTSTPTGVFNPTGLFVVHPGETLSGFLAASAELLPPTSVSWFAVEVGFYPSLIGCSFNCTGARDNAGFEGIAMPTTNVAVPEPATLALLAAPLGAMAIIALRRRRRPAS